MHSHHSPPHLARATILGVAAACVLITAATVAHAQPSGAIAVSAPDHVLGFGAEPDAAVRDCQNKGGRECRIATWEPSKGPTVEFINPIDADMRRSHICGFVTCWYMD